MPERSGKASAALGLAIAGLVTSIVGIGLIFALAAWALSNKALKEIDASNGEMTGRRVAAWAHGIARFSAAGSALVIFLAVLVVLINGRLRRHWPMTNPPGTPLIATAKNMVLWSDQFYQTTQDFPRVGLDPDPTTLGYPRGIPTNSPTDRMAALVNMGNDTLAPQLLINPVGTDVAAQWAPIPNVVLNSNNLSYAVLDALNKEWKDNVNASAPLLADKQVGKGSYWNKQNWEGYVAWGDTHVTWESGQNPKSWPSTMMNGRTNAHDDLFNGTTGPGATDAVLFNP